MPEPTTVSQLTLKKADYDYLVRQASRGALLCEFLNHPDALAKHENTIARYFRELQGIEQAVITTVCDVNPS